MLIRYHSGTTVLYVSSCCRLNTIFYCSTIVTSCCNGLNTIFYSRTTITSCCNSIITLLFYFSTFIIFLFFLFFFHFLSNTVLPLLFLPHKGGNNEKEKHLRILVVFSNNAPSPSSRTAGGCSGQIAQDRAIHGRNR